MNGCAFQSARLSWSTVEHRLHPMYRKIGKRALDLAISIPAFLLLTPILAFVSILVRLSSWGPVFFVQDRLGVNGKVFRLYKFRTMVHRSRTPDHEIIGRDPEVTAVGYWLRRFKLDELPQIFNVIKGDMSIVGPRPALPAQLEEYNDLALRRLVVRPGLTGLAQVNGNIHLSWSERWQYDASYVENLSFWLDIKIIIRTIAVVLWGEQKFYKQPAAKDLDFGHRLRKSDRGKIV